MADTIITNTPRSQDDSSSSGLIVALVIIVALIVGTALFYQNGYFRTNPDSTTNIKVSLPDVTTPTPAPAPVTP